MPSPIAFCRWLKRGCDFRRGGARSNGCTQRRNEFPRNERPLSVDVPTMRKFKFQALVHFGLFERLPYVRKFVAEEE
jgi:hypothetical protein